MKQLELKKLIKRAQSYEEKRIKVCEHPTTALGRALLFFHTGRVEAYQEVLLAMDKEEGWLFYLGIMDQDKEDPIDTLIQGRG